MAVRAQVSTTINRPVAEVFHFFADEHVRNHPRWDPNIQLEQVSEGTIRVGTVIRRRNMRSGTPVEGRIEVVEYEPHQVFSTVIYDGASVTHGRVTFEAVTKEQTTLTINTEFTDMDPSLESWITGMMERSVQNIKQLIESEV